MVRIAAVAAAIVIVLAVGSQLAIPELGEDDIAERLTEAGGSAEVTLEAVPAVRLLLGDGDAIEVRGSGLELELPEDSAGLDRLEGFDDVDIALEDFRAGPLEVSSFSLARAGEAPYSMRMSATSSPASLVGFGAERLGISAAPLLGFVAEQTDADRRFPIELDVELVSEEGRIDVVSGSGTVAGFPTGPLAEIITAAVVGSL